METMDTGLATQAPAESAAPASTEAAATSAPQTTDIDGYAEFNFQGQKYTPTQLARVLKEHGDFSGQVESLRSYHSAAQNLKIDLDTIARRPDLAWQFKEKYPEELHFLVDQLGQTASQPAPQETNQSQLPKEFLDEMRSMKSEIQAFKEAKFQSEVAAQEAYLQKTVDPLFDKYPYANTEDIRTAIFAKAQMAVDSGYRMTEAAWEREIKDAHLRQMKAAESFRQSEIKKQQELNAQGADVGRGGTPPGQAPPKAPRTWDEAEREALRQLKARG